MKIHTLMWLAKKRLGGPMESSAALCLEYAQECLKRDDFKLAREHILKSLRHTVGILHIDYECAESETDLVPVYPEADVIVTAFAGGEVLLCAVENPSRMDIIQQLARIEFERQHDMECTIPPTIYTREKQ